MPGTVSAKDAGDAYDADYEPGWRISPEEQGPMSAGERFYVLSGLSQDPVSQLIAASGSGSGSGAGAGAGYSPSLFRPSGPVSVSDQITQFLYTHQSAWWVKDINQAMRVIGSFETPTNPVVMLRRDYEVGMPHPWDTAVGMGKEAVNLGITGWDIITGGPSGMAPLLDFTPSQRLGGDILDIAGVFVTGGGVAPVLAAEKEISAQELVLAKTEAESKISAKLSVEGSKGGSHLDAGLFNSAREKTSVPSDRLQLEKQKTIYRQKASWKNPVEIKNAKLKKIVADLYRENATVGSGSSADALRVEAEQGVRVHNREHSIKARLYLKGIDKLLKSRSLSSHEEMIAENIRLDLKDALGDKLWYSKTSTPTSY